MLDRCGTADLERVAPQRTSEWKDGPGNTNYNEARIVVVATLPGRDELRWLDITIRRPTAATNVQGAAHHGGCAALNNNRHRDEKSALGQ